MANTMNAPIRMAQPAPLSSPTTGFGPGGPLPAPTPWTNYGSWIAWGGGVVVGNPTGGNLGPGTINAISLFVNGVPFSLGNYLPLAGGVIAGNLTINGNLSVGGTTDGVTLDMGTY